MHISPDLNATYIQRQHTPMPFSVKQPEQFPLFLFTLLPSMHMEYIVVLGEMVEAIADL